MLRLSKHWAGFFSSLLSAGPREVVLPIEL
jgi:hypothetical protein